MSDKDFSLVTGFEWDSKWNDAVKMLAVGDTVREVAEAVGVTERTIYLWKNKESFAAEVDRLSLIYGLASKAERTRLLMRMAKQKVKADGSLELDDTSLMDIIKEMRMQIEGTRIDISTIYTALSDEARSVARAGQVGDGADDDQGQAGTE